MRARPGRQRVRGEARVHERDGAREVGRAQVGIEVGELLGHEHSLVHDRARREADDVEAAARADRVLRLPADDVQLPLERLLVGAAPTRDEHLPEDGRRGARDRRRPRRGSRARRASRGRAAPPPRRCSRAASSHARRSPGVGGEEEHADGVAAGPRELEPELASLAPEEVVRELDDDAGAVAGARDRSRPRRGATRFSSSVRPWRTISCDARAADVGDESDAARVALVALRIVQALPAASVRRPCLRRSPRVGDSTKKPLLTAGQEGPLHHSVPASS